MKRLLCVLLAAVLLSGCAEKAPAPEIMEQTTLAAVETTEPETSPTDYVGEEPTRQELATFFINYTYHDYEDFPNMWDDPDLRNKIHYIGVQDTYACVYVEMAGTLAIISEVIVYRFRCADGQIQITDWVSGEVPLSGCMSVNLVKADGKYVYYGAVFDEHWNHQDSTKRSIDWKSLRITDESGNFVDIDMSGKLAYLCVLDAPLDDFQVIDQDGNMCLDYDTFIQHGYTMWKRDFHPVEE